MKRTSQLEEVMKRQNLRPWMAVAALTFGITIASVPAFAQKGPNDGGTPAEPAAAAPSGMQSKGKVAPTKPATPQLGRNINDGGMPAEPNAAALNASKSANKTSSVTPAKPQLGRNINDGGSIQ
jgi:hypothetical protein